MLAMAVVIAVIAADAPVLVNMSLLAAVPLIPLDRFASWTASVALSDVIVRVPPVLVPASV